MAQFGNRMFGKAVPGLLGGISDMMARYPAPGGMTRPAFNKMPPQMGGEAAAFDPNMMGGMPNAHGPAFNKMPPGAPAGERTNYPGIERPMPPAMPGGGSMTVGNEFHTGTMPMPGFQRPNRPDFNFDLSQAQNLPAFMQPGGPTNYPGIEPPMPPMGGSVGVGMRPPFMSGGKPWQGLPRPPGAPSNDLPMYSGTSGGKPWQENIGGPRGLMRGR